MDNYAVIFRLPATPGKETITETMNREDAHATANEARRQGYQKVKVVQVA